MTKYVFFCLFLLVGNEICRKQLQTKDGVTFADANNGANGNVTTSNAYESAKIDVDKSNP